MNIKNVVLILGVVGGAMLAKRYIVNPVASKLPMGDKIVALTNSVIP